MTSSAKKIPTAGRSFPLESWQTLALIVFGAVLWFTAAMLMRWLVPLGALQGLWFILTYALVIPGTIPFVLLAKKTLRLPGEQIGLALAIVTASAALLDGIAFQAFPELYAADDRSALQAAATILWGAGVGLAIGAAMNRRAQSE